MFKIGDRIRHKICLDIDMVICSITLSTTGLTLEVLYYNRHYRAFAHPATDWVEIKHEDLDNWKLIEERV